VIASSALLDDHGPSDGSYEEDVGEAGNDGRVRAGQLKIAVQLACN
jgi:hypothetical protein